MYAFLNVNTAEKGLQFGLNKCKSMLIGKNQEIVINNKLFVDKCSVERVADKMTGDTELVEHYDGLAEIGTCTEHQYLIYWHH